MDFLGKWKDFLEEFVQGQMDLAAEQGEGLDCNALPGYDSIII